MTERIITDKDGRIFRARGTIQILDRADAVSSAKAFFNSPALIPVVDDTKTTIGFATGVFEEGRLIATVYLNYYCPERLALDNEEALYLKICTDLPYSCLLLDATPNSDDRILPVKVVQQ